MMKQVIEECVKKIYGDLLRKAQFELAWTIRATETWMTVVKISKERQSELLQEILEKNKEIVEKEMEKHPVEEVLRCIETVPKGMDPKGGASFR